MKKILIFSFILSLLIICACNLVYATVDVNMNLISSNSGLDNTVYGSNSNANNNTNTNDDVDDVSDDASSPYDIMPYTSSSDITVGSTAALSSTDLSLSNILNIILIVLGILLVLFAIAILIRMR